MSYYVKPELCPNYDDYQDYGQTSCTLKTWPDMWPEEIAAEKGLVLERRKFNATAFIMAMDRTWRTIQHFRTANHNALKMNELVKRALTELADIHGWKVKNYDCVKHDFVSPIFRTSLRIDEDDSMDVDFAVVFPHVPKIEQKPNKRMTPMERQKLVTAVLVKLAGEQGWQEQKPICNSYLIEHLPKTYRI